MPVWTIDQYIDIGTGQNATLQWPDQLFANGDRDAHTWRVHVTRNGLAVDLSGVVVTCYVVRPRRESAVLISGNASGNVLEIVFPAAVYAYSGNILAMMKYALANGSVTTAAMLFANVQNALPSSIVDPDEVLPSIEELLALIHKMETLADDMSSTEALRMAAEKLRAQAEALRVSAESARVSREDARQAAETGRVSAETVRKTAEADRVKLYETVQEAYENGDLTGPQGETGQAATIQVIQTIMSGANAAFVETADSTPQVRRYVAYVPKPEGLTILAVYETLADLKAAHPTGNRGDLYVVGTPEDNALHAWDVDAGDWADIGPITASEGASLPENASSGQVLVFEKTGDDPGEWVPRTLAAADVGALAPTSDGSSLTIGTGAGAATLDAHALRHASGGDDPLLPAVIGAPTISQLPRRNILHNWDFRNPVNQRLVTGTITTAGYFIDRWRLASGSVTLTANGLALNGAITQILEFPIIGDTFASVKMYSGTATPTYNNATRTFSLTSSGGTIACAKLEMGTVSTLEADPPADFGEQLALCQRFQLNLFYTAREGQGYLAMCSSNGSAVIGPMATPATLRKSPTLSIPASDLANKYYRAWGIGTEGFSSDIGVLTSMTVLSFMDNGIALRATFPNQIAGNMYMLYCTNKASITGPFLLDANL